MKNRSHRYDINRPRPRYRHKYTRAVRVRGEGGVKGDLPPLLPQLFDY